MRILGCVLVLLVLGACGSTDDGPGGGTADPAAQEQLGRDALKAASPGISAALAPTSHTFGGMHLSCRLGPRDFEYTINGGVIADAGTWSSGLQALSDELADSGWTVGTSADDTVVTAKRDDVTLNVLRQRRTEEGVEWVVQITTPCVTYAEEDADRVRLEGGTDDLTGDF